MAKSDPLEIEGSMTPAAQSLSGSKRFPLVPPDIPLPPGISKNRHDITVTWHLHKMD